RASLQASLNLVRRGRELMEQGQLEDAYHAFRRAYQFDQTNELARDLSKKVLEMLRGEGKEPSPPSSPFGSTEPPYIQSGRATPADQQPAPVKDPTKDVKQTIIFHDQLKAVITQLAKQLGINVAFDQSVQDRRVDVELQNITLAKALDTILLTNGLFFQPINENSIIVAQDQPVNRNRLQQMSVQTFYLKNLDAQQLAQVQQVLTMFFGQRVQSWPMQDMRALIVRTAPENMKLVAEIIETIDKERPQVMIDVSIYEVSRNDLLEIGNQLLFDGFLGQAATSGPLRPGTLNLLGITAGQILTEQRLALAVPTSIIRALQTRGNSRLIDSIQVHALDGQQVTANIGRSIPIQTASLPTSFVNVTPTQPNQPGTVPPGGLGNIFGFGYPQIEYRDVGLNVTITPTIYTDEDIKLEMQVETSGFVEGPTQLTPIITRRSLKSVATVKTGQAAMMAGVAQRRNEQTRGSLPLLGFLPVVGRFFSIPKETGSTTDLLITVTPHIVRAPTIEDKDRLARLAGTLQAQGVNDSIENFVQRMYALQAAREEKTVASGEKKTEPTPAPTPEVGKTESKPEPELVVPAAAQMLAGGEPISALLQLVNTTPPRVNELLQVAVFLNSPEQIKEGKLTVTYDPKQLRWVRASEGGLLSTTESRAEIESVAEGPDRVTITARTTGDARPARGRLAILYFDVLAPGNSQVEIDASRSSFVTGDGRTVGCRSIPLTVSAR
ncbi:MAG TPA: hypothetical protein VNM72_15425, partial [Blastocatellia bacterium]|nr:hypothetical protein [Blastocatellia bacterium]